MTVPNLILRLEPLPADEAQDSDSAAHEESRRRAVATAASTGSRSQGSTDIAPPVVHLEGGPEQSPPTPLARWSAATAAAHDACLVVDPDGAVVSLSAPAAELLGCSDGRVIGRQLLDVVDVVDLDTGARDPEYAPRITPLAVLRSRGLMRSLMRVRHHDDALVTIDSTSCAVHGAGGETVGSVSFLAMVAAQ